MEPLPSPSSLTNPRRYTCQIKREQGKQQCLVACPVEGPGGVFEYRRIESPGDVPAADPRVLDVAVLDMNHGWPNLGHDSLVHAVQDAACDLRQVLEEGGLRVRALSYEVRQNHMIPEAAGGRFAVYLGTGGPGHLDPRQNDGVADGSQGLQEDPAWEAPLFRLFDGILAEPETALLAVCHSYGVMCRWSGVARPVLRGAAKGGKSAGLMENVLTPEGMRHPWFAQLADDLPDHRHLRVMDHRLYDLIPEGPLPPGVTAVGYETAGAGGPAGEALTMVEWARDPAGVMPRVFAVNHHPEIVDRSRQMHILQEKRARGEVSEEWCADRARVMTETYPDGLSDYRLHLTSDYTFMGPFRYHLYRQVRRRAQALGIPADLHEDRVFERLAAR
jgi:hypothetical protein